MKAHILVVEDEPELRRLIAAILEKSGYTVAVAEHGGQAIALLRQKTADLVITDLLMPEQDGIETILKLRQHWPKLPVIAISGGGQLSADYYLKIAKQFGAASLLMKPFTPEELLQHIATVLESPS
jgi:two-component system chemotaxis response regulator CheY